MFCELGDSKNDTTPSSVHRPGDRVILPMSSCRDVSPGESVRVVGRPENGAFQPERLIVGGTPANWSVGGIWIGGRPQFSQSGDVSGEMFSATTDERMSFDAVQADEEFVVLATYVRSSGSDAPFVCAVLGTAI